MYLYLLLKLLHHKGDTLRTPYFHQRKNTPRYVNHCQLAYKSKFSIFQAIRPGITFEPGAKLPPYQRYGAPKYISKVNQNMLKGPRTVRLINFGPPRSSDASDLNIKKYSDHDKIEADSRIRRVPSSSEVKSLGPDPVGPYLKMSLFEAA
ncbi:hypothetical protein TNCV_5045881 [Trichonephila clavipes]|uniref:Uncharacterized protein n=1 Tax=Trichonephila clavipes TaxID=2585209 RepID=A0A8X6WHS8_TRICX|nr:hypothetical protein TNCV_5045881 [Trichonephila clavipes]